ncbi:hypothetical protein PBCVCvsA1_173L [Paramecium bursaria Chlorella virus CvsA1]|nr:hypothetical protein PBCVCviKI_164L [Paramecium bursaria Chlorella virus CviKI]AGE52440.1 hypothetical protein PBCVCvsA1_173L [Paramecium bursaria Chlorella virus CvsA1]
MVNNYEAELFEREMVDTSDVESVSDSVEYEPYVSYDDDINEFLDKENDWMFDDGEEGFVYPTGGFDNGELPDVVDDVIIDNLTPEMVRVINRLYPGDIVKYSYV